MSFSFKLRFVEIFFIKYSCLRYLQNIKEKLKAITNGQLRFQPPKDQLNVLLQENIQLQTTTESVTVSLIDPKRKGSMTWKFKSPYIMVGGQVRLDFENRGVSGEFRYLGLS